MQTGRKVSRTRAHGSCADLTVAWMHRRALPRGESRKDMSMSSVVSHVSNAVAARGPDTAMNPRAALLAQRLEAGALALASFAATLTEKEWATPVPKDGRPIRVVVHHVASVYPLEIHLAQTVAGGNPVTGVTMDDVHRMNAAHASEHAGVSKAGAIDLLRRNSDAAAAAIRALDDEDLHVVCGTDPASRRSQAVVMESIR